MTHQKAKFAVGGLILVLAVGVLGFAGMKDGWVYYVPIEQFDVDGDYGGQRMRLSGDVAGNDLNVDPGGLTAEFMIHGGGKQLPVSYRGMVPDMFKVGAQVIVEGRINAEGVFEADTLLTKCASKYEEADQSAGHSDSDPNTEGAMPSQIEQPRMGL